MLFSRIIVKFAFAILAFLYFEQLKSARKKDILFSRHYKKVFQSYGHSHVSLVVKHRRVNVY